MPFLPPPIVNEFQTITDISAADFSDQQEFLAYTDLLRQLARMALAQEKPYPDELARMVVKRLHLLQRAESITLLEVPKNQTLRTCAHIGVHWYACVEMSQDVQALVETDNCSQQTSSLPQERWIICHQSIRTAHRYLLLLQLPTPRLIATPTHTCIREILQLLTLSYDRAVRESSYDRLKHRLSQFVEHSVDAMAMHDAKGRMLDCNPAYEQFMGYPKAAMLGKTLFDLQELFSEEDIVSLRKTYETLLTEQASKLVSFKITRPDYSTAYGEANARQVYREDGRIGVDIVIRDVTKRIQVQQQKMELETRLQHAQRLELMGQLASSFVHDFNNLLTIIQMSAWELETSRSEGHEEIARTIITETEKAATLVRRILKFSRRHKIKARTFDINATLTKQRESLQRFLHQNIKYETMLSPEPALVSMDPLQFEQILLNLLANASDAMPEGGTLTISTSQRRYAEQSIATWGVQPGVYVQLEVKDSGVGITEKVQAKIFDAYFTTKEADKGTGLGLAIVRDLLQEYEGNILVSSRLGQGTVFTILLPCKEHMTEANHVSIPALAPLLTKALTIILVEGNHTLRQRIEHCLRDVEHQVLSYCNAEEVLTAAPNFDFVPQLLLTDTELAGQSGVSLATTLQTSYPEMRVLYISGNVRAQQQYQLTNQSLLLKPFRPSALFQHIARLFSTPPKS